MTLSRGVARTVALAEPEALVAGRDLPILGSAPKSAVGKGLRRASRLRLGHAEITSGRGDMLFELGAQKA